MGGGLGSAVSSVSAMRPHTSLVFVCASAIAWNNSPFSPAAQLLCSFKGCLRQLPLWDPSLILTPSHESILSLSFLAPTPAAVTW